MTDGVARVMRAVARAHRTTGAPITVHTHPGTQTGLAVKALLCDEEGVDPTRVVLGHSGDSEDVDHLSALADEGFILGMDRFGLNVETTFEARADTVVEMCRRGYADRMVLAHDAACYIDWIDPNVLAMMTQWSYLHIHDEVLPYMREHGVTEDQIDTMLVGDATPLLRAQRARTEPDPPGLSTDGHRMSRRGILDGRKQARALVEPLPERGGGMDVVLVVVEDPSARLGATVGSASRCRLDVADHGQVAADVVSPPGEPGQGRTVLRPMLGRPVTSWSRTIGSRSTHCSDRMKSSTCSPSPQRAARRRSCPFSAPWL